MTPFDDRARSLAARLIARYGKTAVFRRMTRVHDPVTGALSVTAQDFTVKVSPPERFARSLVDGTLVKFEDLQVHLAAENAPAVPEPLLDRLIIDQISYEVLEVRPVMSGEATAFYTLHLRR